MNITDISIKSNSLNRLSSLLIMRPYLLLSLTLVFCSHQANATVSGKVVMAKGIVTAVGTDQTSRILGKGVDVREGDQISTADKSFAVIRMFDKTKLTLKPNTTMVLGKFDDTEGKEEACVNLLKGGLRTVSGLIGQKKPQAFQLDTPVASIGIRGTDFTTLICQDGGVCSEEEQEYQDQSGAKGGQADSRQRVIDSIPQGIYSSCETGAVTVSKCVGQSSGFEPGKCRINQERVCLDIGIGPGEAAYASYGTRELKDEAKEGSQGESGESSESDSDDQANEDGQGQSEDSDEGSGDGSSGDSSEGKSAVASEQPSDQGTEQSIEQSTEQSTAPVVEESSGPVVEKLQSVPKILSEDPYFNLSDLSDDQLENINLLIEDPSGGSMCEVSG